MIRFGIITDRQPSTARVRVSFPEDGIVSAWLPVLVTAAAGNKFYALPDIGDQVAVAMQDDDIGVVLGAMYSDGDPIPSGANGNKTLVRFSDGVSVEYDRVGKRLSIFGAPGVDVFASTVLINSTGGVIVESNVEIIGNLQVGGGISANDGLSVSGDVEATGEVTAQAGAGGVSLSTHIHTSASPGSPTTPPTPGT
jgi:phage baseplate assembly protein V